MTLNQLAEKAANIFKINKQKLVTAESCTGGGLSYWLTSVSGSSAWFDRGFVTYSNASKVAMLGVNPAILLQHGAVSEPVALAMAKGALKMSTADVAIAVTGIAGPTGGMPDKPVGTVWIALVTKKREEAHRYLFTGDRDAIRTESMKAALMLLINQPV